MHCRYLARFQNHSHEILKVLNDHAKGEGNEKVDWNPELITEFEKVKSALDDLCTLHPFEPHLPTVVGQCGILQFYFKSINNLMIIYLLCIVC